MYQEEIPGTTALSAVEGTKVQKVFRPAPSACLTLRLTFPATCRCALRKPLE
jgi:hypothetical protein